MGRPGRPRIHENGAARTAAWRQRREAKRTAQAQPSPPAHARAPVVSGGELPEPPAGNPSPVPSPAQRRQALVAEVEGMARRVQAIPLEAGRGGRQVPRLVQLLRELVQELR